MLTRGLSGMVMISIVIENRGSQLIRWCANSTIGTRCPIAGVVMNTTSNLVMAVLSFLLDYLALSRMVFGSMGVYNNIVK